MPIDQLIGTPVVVVNQGAIPVTVVSSDDLDTDGQRVPTNKAHTYTYDSSGNLATDTVTDGASSWVRTYTYANGAQVSDSGWVKQ